MIICFYYNILDIYYLGINISNYAAVPVVSYMNAKFAISYSFILYSYIL